MQHFVLGELFLNFQHGFNLGLAILAAFAVGCKELASVTRNYSSKNSQCRSDRTATTALSQAFAHAKVLAPVGASLGPGAKWTAIVDHSCLQKVKDTQQKVTTSDLRELIYQASSTPATSTLGVLKPLVQDDESRQGERSHSVILDKTYTVEEMSHELLNDPCLKGFAPSLTMYPVMVPNDPGFTQQAHHTILESSAAWDIFYDPVTGIRGEIVIAVIDSGLDINHEDIRANLWINSDEIPNNQIDDDRNGYVDDVRGYNFAQKTPDPSHSGNWQGNFHGTHVAGLAAAVMNNASGVTGVMGRHAKIMPLNIFGANPGTESEYIDNAIRYAADNGAHVINLSVGGPGTSETTAAAIEYALRKGVVLVAAAGNSTANIDEVPFSPAGYSMRYPGMLSVGSTDAVTRERSHFSNFGPLSVEIAAPGSNGIVSTMPNNLYGAQQGTSMASPITAGAAALTYAFIRSRAGTTPTPELVEVSLLQGSEALSKLSNFFRGGKHLQLKTLATYLDQTFSQQHPSPTPGPTPLPTPVPSVCP